jgi:hypothetical protein
MTRLGVNGQPEEPSGIGLFNAVAGVDPGSASGS